MATRPVPPRRVLPQLNEVNSQFILSFVVGLAILLWLIARGDAWDFVANTRLLDLLIAGGFVQLHDAGMGFIAGVPQVQHILAAQDPIDWRLIGIVVAIYIGFGLVKGYQAHRLALFAGVYGTAGQHLRAHVYGDALSRFLPFRLGNVAMASAMQGQGGRPEAVSLAMFLIGMFTVFEILLFSAVGVALFGWTSWLFMMLWAFVALGVGYFILRPARVGVRSEIPGVQWFKDAGRAVAAMWAREPLVLVAMAALSIVSFLLFELAAYLTTQAFTGVYVILNVEPSVLMAGLVAMYIARLIPFTPGGIGPAEGAFAMALYYGGLGYPDAIVIAVLVMFLRHMSAVVLLGIVLPWLGIETNIRAVIDRFRSAVFPVTEPAGD